MSERQLYDPSSEHRTLCARLKDLCSLKPRGLRYFSPIHNLQPVFSQVHQEEGDLQQQSASLGQDELQVKLLEVVGDVKVDRLEIEGVCVRPENKMFNDCVLQLHHQTTPFRLCTETTSVPNISNILYGVIGPREWEQACQQQGLIELPLSMPMHLTPAGEVYPWTNPTYHHAALRIRKQQDGRYIYLEFSKLPNSHEDYTLEVWVEKHDTRFLQELPLIGNTPMSRKRLFSVPTYVANACWLGIETWVPPSLAQFFAFALRLTLSRGGVFEGDAMVPLFSSPQTHFSVDFGASYLKVPPNTPAKPSIASETFLRAHLSRQDFVHLDAREYHKLEEILQVRRGDEGEKLGMVANVLAASSGYDWQFVTALGGFYGNPIFCKLTSQLLKAEIIHCHDPHTLFRAPTLAAKCFEFLLRAGCQQYLHKVLSEYYQVGEGKPLVDRVTCFVEASIKHAVLIPDHIRWVCKDIRGHVGTQFPEPTPIHVTCITSFLYLRLLVPCLLNPNLFLGPELLLVTKHAATKSSREGSMQVAKVVQVIANLNGGSNYAKSQPVLNHLIVSFFPKICLYVMQASTCTDDPFTSVLTTANEDEDKESNSSSRNKMPLLQFYLSQYLTPALDGWLSGVRRRSSLLSIASSRSSHSGTRETPIDVLAQQDNQITLEKEAGLIDFVEALVQEGKRLDVLVEEGKQRKRMEEEEGKMRVTSLGKKVPKNL